MQDPLCDFYLSDCNFLAHLALPIALSGFEMLMNADYSVF